MRTRIEKLSPEDDRRFLDLVVEYELAQCGILDEQRAREAIREYMLFLRDIAERYELDDEEDFTVDHIYGVIYYPKD